MPRTRWENSVVELLTEVSILQPLVKERIEAERPEGLNECKLAICMILTRQDGVSMARSALVWTLEDSEPGVNDDLDSLIALGLVAAEGDGGDPKLLMTDKGRSTCQSAIHALIPTFAPVFQDMPVEEIENAMKTLREARRTLDNLPS
jgi:hypothetical protein